MKESCRTSRACGPFVLHTIFKVDNLYMCLKVFIFLSESNY